MRYLSLILSTLISFSAIGQENVEAQPKKEKYQPKKFEIGIATGIALNDNFELNKDNNYFNYHTLRGYYNRGNMQYAVGTDANYFQVGKRDELYSSTTLQLIPHIAVNRMAKFKYGYVYGGALLGYLYQRSVKNLPDNVVLEYLNQEPSVPIVQGFSMGLQSGIVIKIWGRIAINAETAIRVDRCYEKDSRKLLLTDDYYKYWMSYFPTKVGLRVGI